MFRRWRDWREEQAKLAALPSDGPVDVAGIRALIAEVLAALPPGAAEVREDRGRLQQYPDVPEHEVDYLELHVVPRAAGAVDITIRVFERFGGVDVFLGDSPPIELTTPMNVNNLPPRPFLDVIREVAVAVTAGRVDVGAFPESDVQLVEFWDEGGREDHYGRPKARITWSAAAPWS